jgi:hypothetical protein
LSEELTKRDFSDKVSAKTINEVAIFFGNIDGR